MSTHAVHVGEPDATPEIEVIPLVEPVPRETDFPTPTKTPLHSPDEVPEREPAKV